MSAEGKCYGCEGGSVWEDNLWGKLVTLCKACGLAIQPLVVDKYPFLSPARCPLTDARQSWSTEFVDYALFKGWQRGSLSVQSGSTSEICCPNSGCRKMNDADAKSCWWCSGRLVPK